MKKRIALAVIAAAAAVSLAGCGQAPWENSLRDYENAKVVDPGEITLYNNIDQHPNIARVCAGGLGFATTTRPDMGAVMRVPEWDAHCAKVADKPMR